MDVDVDIDLAVSACTRLQKVGICIWDDLGWFSFSRLQGWGTVIFQLSGFYCTPRSLNSCNLGS